MVAIQPSENAIACHPRSSSEHLDLWGDHIPQWKNHGFAISFLVAEVSGFFLLVFFPGINAPFGQAFLKGRSHRSSTVFPEHEENEGFKKFHQFGVWKVFVWFDFNKKKRGSFWGSLSHPRIESSLLCWGPGWFFDQWATWLEKNGRFTKNVTSLKSKKYVFLINVQASSSLLYNDYENFISATFPKLEFPGDLPNLKTAEPYRLFFAVGWLFLKSQHATLAGM